MIKIHVKVKTQSKKTKVLDLGDHHFRVEVKAAPIEGKANIAVVDALHEYFGLPKNRFTLIRGEKLKDKVFTVDVVSLNIKGS